VSAARGPSPRAGEEDLLLQRPFVPDRSPAGTLRKQGLHRWRGLAALVARLSEALLNRQSPLHSRHFALNNVSRRYDLMAGAVTRLAAKLKRLPAESEVRVRVTQELLDKLESMGVIDVGNSLLKAERIPASAFARRRLPVVMVRLKMADTVADATRMVKHGHVRIGPEVVTDPAYLVTRTMEDFVTWVDSSKIKRAVQKYNDKLDDFDLLGE
jgi:U3 small nucleolar ribonucleoprotein protein IMP3